MRVAAASVLLFLASCNKDEEVEYVRFNQDGDVLDIEVTADAELGAAVEVALLSTTGSVEVGIATVDPGTGPVGTDHDVLVEIDDEWQEVVGLVTLSADAGERGVETYTFRQDSADHGVWVLALTSLGDVGETRTDTLNFELWRAADVDVEVTEDETAEEAD